MEEIRTLHRFSEFEQNLATIPVVQGIRFHQRYTGEVGLARTQVGMVISRGDVYIVG